VNSRARSVAVIAGSVCVVGAVVVLVWSALTTSSARVSASTEAAGFFSSGTIELDSPTSQRQFLFDVADLYPGRSVEGCVEFDYTGSIPGTVRLFATPVDSTGLDRFIDLEVAVSTAPGGCDAFVEELVLFDDGLDTFWRTHDSYGSGLTIGESIPSGSRLALWSRATLDDDNDAQGRTIDFSMLVEVRP
jgi:hypothetical protein